MAKRLLDFDALTNTKTWHEYDPMTKQTIITTEQDVEPHLELNKMRYNDDEYSKQGIKNEWWHVARIPNVIINKWLIECGIDVFNKDHWPAVKRKLADPEWRYLKVTPKRI